MIGNDNINPIKRELAKTFERSANHYDAESNPPPMKFPMNLEVLVMRMPILDKIDSLSPWYISHFEMKLT